MSVHPTSAADERNWSLWGRVYTSSLGLERAKKWLLFVSMAVERLLIRMTLGSCCRLSKVRPHEVIKGTGRHGEGAGAADLIEG
jgi:hypothetical protein